MGAPALDVPKQLLGLVDGELGRVLDGAACAVVQALFAVHGRVCPRKQRLTRSRRREAAVIPARGERKCRVGGRQSVVQILECRRHPVGIQRFVG